MKSINKNKLIVLIDLFIGLVLIYACITKIVDFDNFINNIGKNPLINSDLLLFFVPIFLTSEFLLGMYLIINIKFKYNIYNIIIYNIILYLLYFFFFFIFFIFLFLPSNEIPCSCGGIIGNLSYPAHLIFNLFLSILFSFNHLYRQ